MTSTKERQQRAAARAKLARQMAERQAAAKKRRQRIIVAGAAAGLLVVALGTVLVVNAVTGDDETAPPAADATPTAGPTAGAAAGECAWNPEDPNREGYDQLTDVGTPAPDEPREGISTLTIETNRGAIEVEMDRSLVPCTAASMAHLAEQGFYDGSSCHRLVDENIFVLQCGDPTGTGQGGPTYRFAEENLPTGESPTYPKGVVAMAKTSEPGTTGSQFFIVYDDTELPAEYTLLGTVTSGLEIVEEVAAGGHDDAYAAQAGGGVPNEELVLESVQVSDPS